MLLHRGINWGLAGFAFALLVAAEASGGYTFTMVADTTTAAPSGTFTGFRYAPAISGGTVAFEGSFGGSGRGIFTGRGGALTTVAKLGDAAPAGVFTDFGLRGPAVRGGTAVFFGQYASGQVSRQGIFEGNGGPIATIVKAGDPAPYGNFTSFGAPTVSGGTTAFVAEYHRDGDINCNQGNGCTGVFTRTGGVTATVATSANVAPSLFFSRFGTPAVSGNTAAFFGDVNGFPVSQGVFMGSGGALTPVATNGVAAPSGTLVSLGDPAVHGSTTAFWGAYQSSGIVRHGIFQNADGVTVAIAEYGDTVPSGRFTSFGTSPSISDGSVAFFGARDGNFNRGGIYVGKGGAISTVIERDSDLFGGKVLQLGIGTLGLDPDGSGKIAFTYTLFDGRHGIAIATPSIGLPGDYNDDGWVDAADYSVWRDNLGAAAGTLPNDINGGPIGTAQYATWRANFGGARGAGLVIDANAAVPEPTGAQLLLTGLLLMSSRRCRA